MLLSEKTSKFNNHFNKSIFCSTMLMYFIALLIVPVYGQKDTDFAKRFDNIFAKRSNNFSLSGENRQTGLIINNFLRTGTNWSFIDWSGNAADIGKSVFNSDLPLANSILFSSNYNVHHTVSSGSVMSGSLTFDTAAAPTSTDLTLEGTTDWAHWGLTTASSFDHKSNVTQQISNYTRIGSGSGGNFTDGSILYSWSDGTPVTSATNSGSAIYIPGLNKGFEINVPADTTSRTLKVYVGVYAAQGKFEASLSDASAAMITDTSVINQTGSSNQVYTITYNAATGGQSLKVRWTAAAIYRHGNVILQAATLVTNAGTPVNQPPTVNAGADQTITLPSPANLNGTASDDGLPNPPASLTTTWNKVSGPGTVTFANANSLNTTADFSATGVYVLRLTADDGALTATDDVVVNAVNQPPPNQAPTVDAGADQTITLPSSATLSGTATDDGLPNPPAALTITWSKVSGPGTVTFGNANSLNTTADFSATGVYVLRLTANDGSLTVTDDVTINAVNQPPPNQSPTVDAGADQTITLPSSANLNGTATDDGLPNPPASLTITWSKVSGPGTVAFGNVNSLNTTAGFSVAGTYVLRLSANDSLLTTTDDLTVTVASPPTNQPPTVNAGNDQTITLPSSATLIGTASDDGLPNPPAALTTTWSKVSGPGTVTFANANSLNTTADFGASGSYVLRLTANDSLLTSTDDVIITVNNGVPPTASEYQISSSDPFSQLSTHIEANSIGNYVVTWQSNGQDGSGWGVYARQYNSAGVPQGNEFQVNTYTRKDQFVPHVAMDSAGNFVIVWESFLQDGDRYGIYGQRFNSAGTPLGSEFRVNTTTVNGQHDAYIAMTPNGNFVVVWGSILQDGSVEGIYGQRYNSAGVPIGGEFQVNTYTPDTQKQPTVSIDDNGNFVVTWESFGQDGNGWGIYAQRFDAAGMPQGNEFRANTTTSGDQFEGKVRMTPTGEFVITWSSYGQDGSGWGVYAQRYDAAGVPQGNEFQVNTYTKGDQNSANLSITTNGNFLIVWQSRSQDGNGLGCFGRLYNSAGTPLSGEFQLNTYTAGDQSLPFAAMDASGNIYTVWSSRQDGYGWGVYGKRYDANGNPLIAP